MKLLIASDIHGSYLYCKKLVDAFREEKADKLLILGDILYHGPRNDLPEEYAPKKVIEELNPLKNYLLCVRGNCDTEVDQMVLQFPVLADYIVVETGKHTIYCTHGHKYGEDNPLPMSDGSILLCGHTHVPKCTDHGNFIYMNPGSVSIPKENSHHGYMTYEDGVFLWKDFDGNIIREYK